MIRERTGVTMAMSFGFLVADRKADGGAVVEPINGRPELWLLRRLDNVGRSAVQKKLLGVVNPRRC